MGLNFCVNKDDPGPLFDTGLSHLGYTNKNTPKTFVKILLADFRYIRCKVHVRKQTIRQVYMGRLRD